MSDKSEVILFQSIITVKYALYESTVKVIDQDGALLFNKTMQHEKSPIANTSKRSLEEAIQFLREKELIVAEFDTNYIRARLPQDIFPSQNEEQEVRIWQDETLKQSNNQT